MPWPPSEFSTPLIAGVLLGLAIAALVFFPLYLALNLFTRGQAPADKISRPTARSLLLGAGRLFLLLLFGAAGFFAAYALSLDPRLAAAGLWQRFGAGALKIAIIVAGSILAIRLLAGLIGYLGRFLPLEAGQEEERRRLATLQGLLGSVTTVSVTLVAVIMALKELGFDITALITAAGVGGLAISLGAQNLMRDYISGFFLLIENQLRVGDAVKINNVEGVVEHLTLRTVVLRSLDGTAHTIPNGQVTMVANQSKSFARCLLDVEVHYRENLDHVMAVLAAVGDEMAADPAFSPLITGPLEVLGVNNLGSNGVTIRLLMATQPLKQWEVGRELRRRIKNRFDELGIIIPFTHQALHWGEGSKPVQVEVEIKSNEQGAG